METFARVLLTYLLHSSVLLGLAALVRFALAERRLAIQEAFLRAALLGGFLTAGLQIGLDLQPLGGALRLPGGSTELGATGRAIPVSGAAVATRAPALPRAHGLLVPARTAAASEARPEPSARQTRRGLVPRLVDDAGSALANLRGLEWRRPLAVIWAALAVLALVRLGVAAFRLRRLLADRRPIADGRLAPEAGSFARALGLRGTVRLSAAPRLCVPLATGVLRPEVCLPLRAVSELGREEQLALCAHELAHVARRDPAWILLARLAQALAPLQPLNAWAGRRLQALSECLSDDLAVAASARPVGLARSLVDVASWTLAERPVLPAAAAGAFSSRSGLRHRVERLMNPFRSLERPRRALLPLAAVLVLASAFLTPVVAGSVVGESRASAFEPPAPVPPAPLAPAPAPPAPAPQPAPAARPAPTAKPAPTAQEAPAAREAPTAPGDATRQDLERQIDALSHRMQERALLNEPAMKALEAEVQALAAQFRPNEAELKQLGSEIETAAQELTEATLERTRSGDSARASERLAEATRRMAALKLKLRASIKAPEAEQARALARKARELAELARPTGDEQRELQRLTRELTQVSLRDVQEATRAMHDALEQAMRALRETTEEMRRAAEQARDAGRAKTPSHE